MQYTPKAHNSPILAQARSLGMDSNNFDLTTIRGKTQSNPCKNTMSNISTIPSFKTSDDQPLRSDFGMSIDQLIELFTRKAKNVYEKMLISERGKEILAKAAEYNISFDKQNINWLSLINEIEEYEELIGKATQLGLDWDYHYYDLVGLEQAIESAQRGEYLEQQDLCTIFCLTSGVEV